MADCFLAQTILYLRPQSAATLDVLNISDNKPYVFAIAPSDPLDLPLEEDGQETSILPTAHTFNGDVRGSCESTPGLYSISQKVLRLGFNSVNPPSPRGFEVGCGPASDIKVPFYDGVPGNHTQKAYFRIHYNFSSGALLITSLCELRVGRARLKRHASILLNAGISIYCGGEFEFSVEFPDLRHCAEEHRQNYQGYAARLGSASAQYLPSSRDEYPAIGVEHRSVAVLGKGAYGEVHKALNIKTADSVAIKLLSASQSSTKEVEVMSGLYHENIIKYERAIRISSTQICIVMELAVNDLRTHMESRQKGKSRPYLSLQCIRSIGRQALSGLEYLHSNGIMHRDIKPENILVTKWDPHTDTPDIKLGDFGLAGMKAEQVTFCGTRGYVAPEVTRAHELRKQRGKGVNTIPEEHLIYTNAVDIWAMGKVLQELVQAVPSEATLRGGLRIPQNKEPALNLISWMMQDDPKSRPTAAGCLVHSWMASSTALLVKKRGRPPSSRDPTSLEQRLKKALRTEVPSVLDAILQHHRPSMNAWEMPDGNTQVIQPLLQLEDNSQKSDRHSRAQAIQPSLRLEDHNQESKVIEVLSTNVRSLSSLMPLPSTSTEILNMPGHEDDDESTLRLGTDIAGDMPGSESYLTFQLQNNLRKSQVTKMTRTIIRSLPSLELQSGHEYE